MLLVFQFLFDCGRSFASNHQCRRHGGLWWAKTPKRSFKPPQIEIWNTMNQWNFCQIWISSPPCTNVKPPHKRKGPPFDDFLATVLVIVAFVLKIFSFSDKKKILDVCDRHILDAACCSRMSEVRDYRRSWLAVKWCSGFSLILWLCLPYNLLFFYCQVVILYFKVFHNFYIFTLNWYSQLFKISVSAATLRVFATLHVG